MTDQAGPSWTGEGGGKVNETIGSEIVRQSQDVGPNTFVCPCCKNYEGGLKCSKGVFIVFTGANMFKCCFFEPVQVGPHCHRAF